MSTSIDEGDKYTMEGEGENHTGEVARRTLAISCEVLYGLKLST